MEKLRTSVLSITLTSAILLFLAVSGAHAITIVVNNDSDAAVDCTLREAVTSINSISINFPGPPTIEDGCVDISSIEPGIDDRIHFSVATVNLSNGELQPTEDIHFFGGNEGVSIIVNDTSRHINMSFENGISIVLENMTLSGGSDVDGGAINASATLVLFNSTVSGNSATNGGGIYIDGAELILSNSTVSGNSASNGVEVFM